MSRAVPAASAENNHPSPAGMHQRCRPRCFCPLFFRKTSRDRKCLWLCNTSRGLRSAHLLLPLQNVTNWIIISLIASLITRFQAKIDVINYTLPTQATKGAWARLETLHVSTTSRPRRLYQGKRIQHASVHRSAPLVLDLTAQRRTKAPGRHGPILAYVATRCHRLRSLRVGPPRDSAHQVPSGPAAVTCQSLLLLHLFPLICLFIIPFLAYEQQQ
jgi:hypothetical protein